jgi:hypothetical protein
VAAAAAGPVRCRTSTAIAARSSPAAPRQLACAYVCMRNPNHAGTAADHGRTRTQVRERRPANLWGWRSVGGARGDSPDDHGRTRTQAHAVGHWARPTVQAHVHLGQRQRRHCCPLAELIDWRRRGPDGSGEAPEMVRASVPCPPCARDGSNGRCVATVRTGQLMSIEQGGHGTGCAGVCGDHCHADCSHPMCPSRQQSNSYAIGFGRVAKASRRP